MNSKMDLSFSAFSVIQDSVETRSKKLKKSKFIYTIWVHSRTARDEENFRFKFCIYCIETPPYSISVNINIRDYFELKYGIIIDRIPDSI
jgi:hypothetical protein